MIQFTYDEEVRAAYIVLSDKPACRTAGFDGVTVDYDADGNRVGVEILL